MKYSLHQKLIWLTADGSDCSRDSAPVKTLGMKLTHADSIGRKLFYADVSPGRKQDIADSFGGSQI